MARQIESQEGIAALLRKKDFAGLFESFNDMDEDARFHVASLMVRHAKPTDDVFSKMLVFFDDAAKAELFPFALLSGNTDAAHAILSDVRDFSVNDSSFLRTATVVGDETLMRFLLERSDADACSGRLDFYPEKKPAFQKFALQQKHPIRQGTRKNSPNL